MKKFLCLMLLILLVNNTQTIANPTLFDSNIAKKIVYQYIDAINKNDWNTFVSLQLNEYQNDLKKFIFANKKNNSTDGILTVNSAKIKEIKAIPDKALIEVININSYKTKYGSVYTYLVGIDFGVKKQSKYICNGVNYRVIIVGLENKKPKIIFEMDAPLDVLVPKGYGFNSSDEKAALKIIKARYKGIIIDLKGNVLDTNY